MPSKTREKLIEVARQLFAKQGVAHTTMNDIAAASSKGRRTIYTYFKNKREIYNAVLEGESEHLVENLRAVASSDRPVEERLKAFLRMRLERYIAPAVSATLMERIKFDSRRVALVQRLARAKENAMLKDILDEGVMLGRFKQPRCRMLQGFFTLTMTVIDAQSFSASLPEERAKAISLFIEFVISDISVDNKQG